MHQPIPGTPLQPFTVAGADPAAIIEASQRQCRVVPQQPHTPPLHSQRKLLLEMQLLQRQMQQLQQHMKQQTEQMKLGTEQMQRLQQHMKQQTDQLQQLERESLQNMQALLEMWMLQEHGGPYWS